MPPTYKHSKEINEILARFRQEAPEVIMAAVASQDGILLGTDVSEEFAQERFSLMLASMISLASRSAQSLEIGSPQKVGLICTEGTILLTSIEGRGSLACVGVKDTKLGAMLLEMKRISAELAEFVYPVNYGTAFLNPSILDQFEKDHGSEAKDKDTGSLPPGPEKAIPYMHTELFFKQPDTNKLRGSQILDPSKLPPNPVDKKKSE